MNGLTDSFPASLQKILETWVLQMGYPLLTVKKSSDSKSIIVEQEYFLIDKNDTAVNTPGSIEYGYEVITYFV